MSSAAQRAPSYGRGVVEIEDPFVDSHEVLAQLTCAFRAPEYEPPLLPSAALTLLELVRSPDTSARDVLDVLEHDPLVAGRVLRAAQSPVYGAMTPVRTLEQGISRLGMNTMTEIFFHVSMSSRVFRAKGYEGAMDQLRLHSVAVAHVARLVCRATSLPDEYAFLCGLLHDVGIAAGLIVLADVRPPQRPPPFAEVVRPVLEAHTEAAAIVCRAWRLPPDVTMVVEHHHFPRIGGVVHPMAAAVALAEQLCAQHELGDPDEGAPALRLAERPSAELILALSLSAPQWRRLEADAAALLQKLR
jgi:putative nucleotidyltransferase with HDIG domain